MAVSSYLLQQGEYRQINLLFIYVYIHTYACTYMYKRYTKLIDMFMENILRCTESLM